VLVDRDQGPTREARRAVCRQTPHADIRDVRPDPLFRALNANDLLVQDWEWIGFYLSHEGGNIGARTDDCWMAAFDLVRQTFIGA
jgi:hypothetical protein